MNEYLIHNRIFILLRKDEITMTILLRLALLTPNSTSVVWGPTGSRWGLVVTKFSIVEIVPALVTWLGKVGNLVLLISILFQQLPPSFSDLDLQILIGQALWRSFVKFSFWLDGQFVPTQMGRSEFDGSIQIGEAFLDCLIW